MDVFNSPASSRFSRNQRMRKAVIELYGYRCMFPGCREQPNVDGTPLVEIAFICSPVPGGARYDYRLGEIASVDDMLVLCPNHHMLIDRYPEEFSVERLREFKSSGRADAGNSKGDALPFAKLSLDKALEYWGRHRRESKEDFWQSFFEANPHVLSLAFPSAVFRMGSKFYVGGKTKANSGGNLADFAFGETSTQNILLVEIKTPETKLLGRQYREGVFAPSSDLSGSIAQVLSQADNLQKDFFSVCRDHVGAFAYNPRSLILIGDVENELKSRDHIRSFELYRGSLSRITILTYDELYLKLYSLVDDLNRVMK